MSRLPWLNALLLVVVAALGARNAVLLPNHGALAVGRDMKEAFAACEMLEKTAKVYALALALGKVNPVPAEALEAEKAFFAMLQHGEQ